MEKPSSNLQVAISSLVAVIVGHGVQFGMAMAGWVAQIPGVPAPQVGVAFEATVVMFGILFLPLLWWRHKAGYVGSIALGILPTLLYVQGISSFWAAGEITIPELMIPPVALAAISIVLIVYAYRASREKA